MTPEQSEILRILRHHARGHLAARTIDRLVGDLAARGTTVSRRVVEQAIHDLACEGWPVGTGCTGPAKGAFWIVTPADLEHALRNIESRFRPLAIRRRALHALKRRHLRPPAGAQASITNAAGTQAVMVSRDGQIDRTPIDEEGQGLLFARPGGIPD